ncbi:HTH-type transcriptional regulator sgrR [Kingella potus]|uniref:HTH-type transcriptional regulator sgrR n=1 Tax=Kingella potus TaxID=265175 RepID=A0A377R2V8_9NEIS|nr:extracellular solute-binding protein [Kingella potus]STR02841.1 HTH-type transcriptional regulator sgrR [Kingella potus]
MNTSLFLASALFLAAAAQAAADYALGLGQKPLYPAGFSHFAYADPAAPKGGTFSMPLPGSFDTLNPFTLKGTPESGISLLTLDTLMTEGGDDPFAMYGLLAQDAAVAADGLSVTFALNPAARFHNGDPVLAKDVAASFRLLTGDSAAQPMWKLYWADVAAVDTPAPRTVRFRFKRQNAELPLILGQLPVFSHKSYPQGLEKNGGAPIGSGPYRLVKTESGRLAVFARDPAYWAAKLPSRRGMYNFDTVRLHYVRDPAVLAEGVKAGRYDFSQETSARAWARSYPETILRKRGLAKTELAHGNTAGMQGFVMNQRRPALKDIRVRRALILSFDFENINSRMMYNAYRRSPSFFTNSPMAAAGLPGADEAALLAPLKQHLPQAVFTQAAPLPPQSDPVLGIRPNLLKARQLLLEAGYRYQNGTLTDQKGEPLVLEFLIGNKLFERIIAKWQRDLAKIGITLNARTADPSVYQKRMDNFDFDLTTAVYAQSQSPGNEQAGYFSCAAAHTKGSRNLAGLCHPAVEALLPRFGRTGSRAELTAAARALDRVLRHQYIIVPNWYADRHRVIRRTALGTPARPPKYYSPAVWALQTWWVKPPA